MRMRLGPSAPVGVVTWLIPGLSSALAADGRLSRLVRNAVNRLTRTPADRHELSPAEPASWAVPTPRARPFVRRHLSPAADGAADAV